jgi:predicted enzyme related to lactoylglutathione lyase
MRRRRAMRRASLPLTILLFSTMLRADPPADVVYVQVADVRASCAKAKDLGGTVPPGFPFNLPDGAGAVGLAVDPAGHPIGMYSRTPVPSAEPASK